MTFTNRRTIPAKTQTARLCTLCGTWPATRISGPRAVDRLCETCYQEGRDE